MDCGGIPSGLNRIKTSRERPAEWSSSGGDDSPAASGGGDGPVAPAGGGTQRVDKGEGFRRGKKISRWFSSYLINRGSSKSSNILPSNSKVNEKRPDFIRHSEKECLENKDDRKKLDRRNSMKERTYIKKTKKGQKSFSHELGPRGGIPLEQPRARSYNDLEELLKSLHSMYNDAKEEVDAELASLLVDILDVLEKDTYMESRETITDLLVLARQCREMPSLEFRDKCRGIVQDLADKWKQCPEGWLKQVFTRMLFILTRCTRLLQLQNDGKTISEDSIHKFKQCLAGVPMVETGSVSKLRHADLGFPNAPKPYDAPQCKFEMGNKISIDSSDNHVIDSGVGISASPKSHKHMPLYPKEVISLHDRSYNSFPKTLQDQKISPLNNYEELLPASDFVMCRICEENIPTNHLESHSYICAYADKCDSEGFTVDDRLLKVADILEQIVESYKQNFHLTSSPDILGNDKAVCDTRSPKVLEWHTKGAEGMFEDLHEMDTAFIDESQSACFSSLKAHLVTKFGISDVASNGSMTPVSSASTPKTNYFDLFWLEYNNPSEQEDSKLMGNLADAARKIATLDLSNEHSPEKLRDHMNDLQHIMQKSNLRALVIDTFGNRILNLLREKYLLAIKFAVPKRSAKTQLEAATKCKSCIECTESPTASLNTDLSYKERISIDDFEIIKPISRGAFGKVFLARKRTTGDLFAIKVLKKVNMLRKNDIERILSERNILITVRNPFVVRFFYSFTCRDSLSLVMEYLNGGDLYSLLRKVGCLEEDVARIYIAELVLALEYLHSLGIVHRDLKPDNILIAKDGHIKLTDFGLSKIGLLNHTADLAGSRTSTNDLKKKKRGRHTAMGTPDYLAPEILLGTEHGYAADWWSVGIILFEFTTGIPPFAACLPEDPRLLPQPIPPAFMFPLLFMSVEIIKTIFDNILNRRIPWPDVPKDMSYEAKDLIDRLLVEDPNMRLGVNGASEVKNHPFFQKIDWDNFSSQQAAFVPNPDSADDTSYFLSRYDPHLTNFSDNQDPCGMELSDDQDACGYVSDATDSSSNPDLEMYECGHSKNVDDSDPLDLSRIKFSFKNLSQLASMNHDVLIQSGKASNRSSPVTRPSTPS